MAQYKAIMHGLFNAKAVNARFMEVWQELEALKAQLAGGEELPASPKETATADSAETVIIEAEPAFDWKTSDDNKALKEFAMSEFNLKITGNKTAGTIRAEIEGYLSTL